MRSNSKLKNQDSMNKLRYIFFSFVFSLCLVGVSAQSNPAQISTVLLKEQVSDQIVLNSFFLQPEVVFTEVENGVGWGQMDVFTSLGNGEWGTFLTGGTEVSQVSFTVKYFIQNPGSIIPQVAYTKITLETVNSIVRAEADYVIDAGNQMISVMDNDENDQGELNLVTVARSQDLIADTDNNLLDISPLGSEGKMYAQYIVSDELGTSDVATLIVVPNVVPAEDKTVNHFTTNKNTLDFTLPSSGYSLNDDYGLEHGELSNLNDFAFKYQPDENFFGLDSAQFVHNNGNLYTVYFEIFNKDIVSSFLVDDQVYTAQEDVVFFNVRNNDLENNLQIINSSADDHDELEYLGNGEFKYTAPEDFQGVVNYEYSSVFLGDVQTAQIQIVVDDQAPEIFPYHFQTAQGTPFVLDYQVPVSGESFEIKTAPNNGTLQILGNGEMVSGECYEISGLNKIVYVPNDGFVGEDQFEIQYQLGANNNAYNLISNITVLASAEDCNCVENCVWQGDANNDGIVNLLDLFAFGQYFGTTTEPRTNDSDDWIGQSSSSTDPNRFADFDGNGFIVEEDLDDFLEVIDQEHAFTSASELVSTEYDISFVPQQTEIDSGEMLLIDVLVGSEVLPAINVDGISFGLNILADLADSASMHVSYLPDSWFNHNDPTISLTRIPYDGRVETAIVNTANSAPSGIGIIATLGFIVEEDLDDFRFGDGEIPSVHIDFNEIYIAGKNGQVFKLSDQSIAVPFKTDTDDESDIPAFDPNDFLAYPNPSDGQFNLFLNGEDRIQELSIYSLSGLRMYQESNIDRDAYQLDMRQYPVGTYLVQVVSEHHSYTRKIELIR